MNYCISIYAELNKSTLKKLHRIDTELYAKELFDPSIPIQDRTLKKILAKTYRDRYKIIKEHYKINEKVKEILYRQLKNLPFLIYSAMEKNNCFGLHGKEKTLKSLCRSTMKSIPDYGSIYNIDLEVLKRKIKRKNQKKSDLSGEDLKKFLLNYKITIFGKQISITDDEFFEELQLILEADSLMWVTLCNGLPRFIFGSIKKQNVDGNSIVIFQKEYIRTPQITYGVAAEVYKKSSIVLQRSLSVLFYSNYYNFFHRRGYLSILLETDPYELIELGLREMVFHFCNVHSKKELIKYKNSFIESWMSDVVAHEMGHHNSYNDIPDQYFHFHYYTANNGRSAHVRQELLADYAPEKSTFTRILNIAKTNPQLTLHNIYRYLKDNWFVSKEDPDHLRLLCLVSVSIPLKFFKSYDDFDFEGLEKEKVNIYKQHVNGYKSHVDTSLKILHQAKYLIKDKFVSYSKIEQRAYRLYKKKKTCASIEDFRKTDNYYENAFGILEQQSKEGWKKYQDFLKQEDIDLEQEILSYVSNGNNSLYNYSCFEYIRKRLEELEVIYTDFIKNFKLEFPKIEDKKNDKPFEFTADEIYIGKKTLRWRGVFRN